MTTSRPTLRILGIRGIPAAHGGFETFAERLAPYLVSRGWRVIVYCQQLGRGEATSDTWEGIERVHIPVPRDGALGTMHFDLLSTLHARRSPGLCLTLGYNTAFLWPLLRTRGVLNVANMDGIEWRRAVDPNFDAETVLPLILQMVKSLLTPMTCAATEISR